MTDTDYGRSCVLLPIADGETWAVPQNCLAEIVTVASEHADPPNSLHWRGRELPVLDFGTGEQDSWCDPRRGAGLMAVFLGLEGEGCEYYAVALRGTGLSAVRLTAANVKDRPEATLPHATAAFDFGGVVCQVPNLDHLQQRVTHGSQVA